MKAGVGSEGRSVNITSDDLMSNNLQGHRNLSVSAIKLEATGMLQLEPKHGHHKVTKLMRLDNGSHGAW